MTLQNRTRIALAMPVVLALMACSTEGLNMAAAPYVGEGTGPYVVGTNSYDPTLPPEPKLPSPEHVCATLTASFTALSNGLLPDSADDPALGATSTAPDTARVQTALDQCGTGNAVKLIAGVNTSGFITGPISIPTGVTLWIDKGATLYASRDPRQYDLNAGIPSCGNTVQGTRNCKPFINAVGTQDAGIVGDGRIDGRGGSPLLAPVTDNANRVLKRNDGTNYSWWDASWRANKVGDVGNNQANPHLISVSYGSHFTLYRITLQNSPKFHVVPNGVNGFLAWGVKVYTPSTTYTHMKNYLGMAYDIDTAKNTDAFDPGGAPAATVGGNFYSGESKNIVLAYSYISTGDDDFVPKGSGNQISDITVAHNHFYSGHGVSIGSETYTGVKNMRAYDLSFDGDGTSENQALRIKSDASRGGPVTNITYQNICIRNMSSPLVLDTYYSKAGGNKIPDFHDILLKNVSIDGGGKIVVRGWDAAHPVGVTLDNVTGTGAFVFASSKSSTIPPTLANANINVGPGPVSIPFKASEADHVTVTNVTGDGNSKQVDCSKAFVPFPL